MVVVKRRWFKKGIARLRSCQTPAGNSSGCRSGYRAIGLPGFLHGEDKPHQLLGCVGNGYIVVLALCPLLCQISGKGWVPKADIFGGVEKCVTELSGAPFLHVWVTVFQLHGLVSRR